MTEPSGSVVLFDGVCNVCNASVNFIIDHDSQRRFRFASLQSDVGRRLSVEHGLPGDLKTVALIDGAASYVESTAALRIAGQLDGAVRWLRFLSIIPRPIRDAFYRFFSARRYAWFGRTESCRVPTPEIRARFLADG
ncbi:MAG TPA: thiol-disulfide oxidoreductase DCC family protein [Polyangiaceae bacterium]|nr:thiol-disulfide oxidoreductase DCC family protein [Polyangiaceae bacterium]